MVYLCENNLYSVSTRVERQTRETNLSRRAASYGIAAERVDGNDVVDVYLAVERAVAAARGGAGAQFVECLTYRQGGHKRDDPASYRPSEEVELWLTRDPISRLDTALEKAGYSAAVGLAKDRAVAAIDAAVEFADKSPLAVADEAVVR